MLSCEPSEHAAAFLLSVSLQTVQMRRQVVPTRMSLWELARGVGRHMDLTVTVYILDVQVYHASLRDVVVVGSTRVVEQHFQMGQLRARPARQVVVVVVGSTRVAGRFRGRLGGRNRIRREPCG